MVQVAIYPGGVSRRQRSGSMNMRRWLAAGLVFSLAQIASGGIVISEWMYNGAGTSNMGEFVEFTNTGTTSVDMTGWSFDDDSRTAGTISLSAFGVVAPGQSVILTDETASNFATIWGLSGVCIIGSNTANLGRNDEINLFDAGGNLVDRLTYGDENFPGTIRTLNRSCNIPASDYYYMTAQTSWLLATENDSFESKVSTRGEMGSPGYVVAHTVADFDCDGDVDAVDYDTLRSCITGEALLYNPMPSGCTLTPNGEGYILADYDQDSDVDQSDFGVFQRCYSGTGNAADSSCTCYTPGTADTEIILNGSSITVIGGGVAVAGTKATITMAGNYKIRGTLTDGQIVVDSISAGTVNLLLNGINISNSTTSPLYVNSAEEVDIVLGNGTVNYLSDPTTYVYEDPLVTEPNAALFSKDTMKISGNGSLTVYGHYNDGIAGKDELTIEGGTITVNAVDDGIRGKDYLLVTGGNITVTSGGDGLKSDNAEDVALGYISIQGGSINVTSGGDGITAETNVGITGGTFNITSGGGSTVTAPDTISAKGIKGIVSVTIGGGTFTISSADDAIHSNGNITIQNIAPNITIYSAKDGVAADTTVNITGGTLNITTAGGSNYTIPDTLSAKAIKGDVSVVIGGGTFTINTAEDGVHSNATITIDGGQFSISAKDDAVHAETSLTIGGGNINITKCYEGIESQMITINNGEIHIVSSDDGVNVAGGSGTPGQPPPPCPTCLLYINGGYVAVNATGDGIDVNGAIQMTGGTVIVHGPTANNNAAIDYDVSFKISGGFLVAAGSSGMAQAPSTSSTQRSVHLKYQSARTGMVNIQRSGTSLLTFVPAKSFQSLVFSAPTLTAASGYSAYKLGSSTGTLKDGLYTGGTYTPGTLSTTFTISNIVTTLNNVP